MRTGQFLSQLSLFLQRMNVRVRVSFTLFLYIQPPLPAPPRPHHHRATVEVVSGREMMPNLTGVEPYLYSLHSRFCFKGFVYTRPINHLLPSHNPAAFKACAGAGDNTGAGASVNLTCFFCYQRRGRGSRRLCSAISLWHLQPRSLSQTITS